MCSIVRSAAPQGGGLGAFGAAFVSASFRFGGWSEAVP